MEESAGRFLVFENVSHVGTDLGDEVGAEPDRGVVRFDCVFDPDDVDVRGGAGAVLLATAEEVRVFAAAGVHRVLDDQALGGARLVASSTEQRPLQVMVMDATAFASSGAGLQDCLDALEEVYRDERFVATLDLLTVVADVAEVVAIAQHHGQFIDRDLLGGVQRRGTGAQAPVVEFIGQVDQRVIAGGVQLEGEPDKRCAFGVEGDGTNRAVVEALKDVQVAEGRPTERAAVASFLSHLVLDVGPAGLRLILVDRVDDGLHHCALGRIAHVEDRGNNPRADLLEVALDDGRVNTVSKDAVEVVDDDVVDVFLSLDPGDHLLEAGPLVDARCGPTRFDELPHDVGIE